MQKFLFVLFVLLGLLPGVFGQQKGISGTWYSKLKAGVELRMVFHFIKDSTGKYTTVMDSPDQSVFDIPTTSTKIAGDSIFVDIKNALASFAGVLVNDSLITGTFTQGIKFPLQLTRNKVAPVVKPQTPIPPYPYASKDVIYFTPDKARQFGATITIPNGQGPFPAALLITGSGPQNRDEEIMGHKIFAVLADHLTKNGFIVLRVDDRGIGKSTGDFSTATSLDFANDVNNGIEYLKARPEVNKNKIGLIGHSEGGMIAPMVATNRKDIDFLILLAAPGIKITELMTEQNAAILQSNGISAKAAKSYASFYKELLKSIINSPDSITVRKKSTLLLNKWTSHTDSTILKELNWDDGLSRMELLNSLLSTFNTPWFNYFLRFDPQPYLKKVTSKVLAINGSRDLQVIAASNLAGIKKSLGKNKKEFYEIKEMKGLNHLFQTCNSCTLNEYGELNETFSPATLNYITDWLWKNVK